MKSQAVAVCSRRQGAKWKENLEAFEKFPTALQETIKTSYKELMIMVVAGTKEAPSGDIVIEEIPTRAFTQQNLAALAKSHDFIVESTFVTSTDGHLVNEAEIYEKGFHVGVIIQKPYK